MQEIFEHISADMRHVYLLGYQPHAISSDGKWHKIDVTIEGLADARIRAKQGYFPKQLRELFGQSDLSLDLEGSGHGLRAGAGLAAADADLVLPFGNDRLAGFGDHAQVARL